MRTLRKGLEVSIVDNCAVIILPNGDMAIMNETASFMIEKMQAGASQDEVISQTADYYGIDSSIIRHDINDFLTDLESHSLLS